MSRTVRTAAALLLLLAAFGALAALLMPSPASAMQERTAGPAPVHTASAPGGTFLAELVGPGAEVPENAGELLLAADRVCEGITAQVPLPDMVAALSAEPLPGADVPLTEEEAAHLVQTAAAVHCGLPAV